MTVACWSIWLARNELVFDSKCPSMNVLVFQSKLRALIWVKIVKDDLRGEERLWWFCPIRSWNGAIKAGLSGRLWLPPRKGWVNFNLCGIVNEDDVGFGGVLRDEDGVARAVFSGPVVANESCAAEVGAISIALDIFTAMEWMSKSSLSIELGSKEVFRWIENKGLRLWELDPSFREIDSRLSRLGNVCFVMADKNGNDLVFTLAVAGIRRLGLYNAW
ncbi:hypothetical protein PVK06_009650 [Gossypium arboreum]|uniref:RNase H type-1 domain-containing protein n=1 Tax=Gossypium arboreum TaxID=29729 RepID=A0ABR0QN43_GOSAR|nr:hypothetical protein PVK06_009650 [Gossypium arboreum]